MILSLCLFLPALSPSSQEICSAHGALPAPIFYLKQTFPREGDAVLLQCSVFSRATATRIIFCKDGEEISSQRGLEEKITYSYLHAVSRGSSGNYSCGYEIKESNNWVNRSQLSPAKYLSVTGHGGDQQRPAMSLTVWAARCTLVLLLLVSAPIITFVLEKWGLPKPTGLEGTPKDTSSIMQERGAGNPIDQL